MSTSDESAFKMTLQFAKIKKEKKDQEDVHELEIKTILGNIETDLEGERKVRD